MSTTIQLSAPATVPAAAARYAVRDTALADPAQLGPRLAADGLVLFEHLDTPLALPSASAPLMHLVAHPDSGPDGVTALSDLGSVGDRPGQAGFSRRALAAHTDRSGVADPPALIMVVCARPGAGGGHALLTDGAAVYADLAETAPATLAAFHRPSSVLFGGTGGHLGAVLTPDVGESGRCRLRLRLDDLAAWGPDLSGHHLQVLRAAIERNTLIVALTAGRGYLADNHRWLHARTAFTGPRLVYRVLGTPHPAMDLATGIPVPQPR